MKIHNLSFNQDVSVLTCSTNEGYIIYSLKPKIENVEQRRTNGGIGMYKIIYNSNIGILIGGGDTPLYDKNVVIIYDEKEEKSKMEMSMASEVKNLEITRNLIIVCLRTTVFAYYLKKGSLVAQIKTIDNPNGLVSINRDEDNPTLATLGAEPGEIFVLDISKKQSTRIDAHNSGISALALSYDGKLVATASECSTLLRIFNTRSGEQMYEFRRGTYGSKIYDITFNKDSELLACSSASGTVHIFQLTNDLDNTKNTLSMLNYGRNFLPGFFSSQWSFKQIRLETMEKIISGFDDNDVLHIATYDGRYFKAFSRNNDYKLITETKVAYNFD